MAKGAVHRRSWFPGTDANRVRGEVKHLSRLFSGTRFPASNHRLTIRTPVAFSEKGRCRLAEIGSEYVQGGPDQERLPILTASAAYYFPQYANFFMDPRLGGVRRNSCVILPICFPWLNCVLSKLFVMVIVTRTLRVGRMTPDDQSSQFALRFNNSPMRSTVLSAAGYSEMTFGSKA